MIFSVVGADSEDQILRRVGLQLFARVGLVEIYRCAHNVIDICKHQLIFKQERSIFIVIIVNINNSLIEIFEVVDRVHSVQYFN